MSWHSGWRDYADTALGELHHAAANTSGDQMNDPHIGGVAHYLVSAQVHALLAVAAALGEPRQGR